MQPHHAQNNCLLISHIFASFLGCPLTVLSKSIEIEHLSIISENKNFQLVYDVYFSESITWSVWVEEAFVLKRMGRTTRRS